MQAPEREGLRNPGALAATLTMLVGSAVLAGAPLKSEVVTGWTAYVSATERRIAVELETRQPFLASDFTADAAWIRRSVLAGAIPIDKMKARDDKGHSIDVPSAQVHDWRGAVLLPGATLAGVLTALETQAPPVNDDVLRSAILRRGPDGLRVFLRLRRSQIVTVVFNTEHLVTFRRVDDKHATSVSTATHIAEVADPDTSRERELSPSDDHGFLWRWNAYWRYEAVQGGVIAECESISLSRPTPPFVGMLVQPLIDRAARESMERALISLRERFKK